MSNEHRDSVARYLAAHGITVAISGGWRMQRRWPLDTKPWDCFAFTATIKRGAEAYVTEYYVGTGHMTDSEKRREKDFGCGTVVNTAHRPDAADILHSLVLDADSAAQPFSDFCGAMGLSDDSIQALHTYQECERTGKELRRVIGHGHLDALAKLLQDY